MKLTVTTLVIPMRAAAVLSELELAKVIVRTYVRTQLPTYPPTYLPTYLPAYLPT